MNVINEFLNWYAFHLIDFCLYAQGDPTITKNEMLYSASFIIVPICVSFLLGELTAYFFDTFKQPKLPIRDKVKVLDDHLRTEKYVLRVVYKYPPNKKRLSSKYVLEKEGSSPITGVISEDCYDKIFTLKGIKWYVVNDYVSPCRGTNNTTQLRVVCVQPVPTEKNLEAFHEWTGPIILHH